VDLWLAWGQFDIDHYASEGGTTFERTIEIGSSRLALAVPKDLEGRVKSVSDLTDPSVKSVMVGDPETVAVGHHAKQALETLGLWSRIESRLDINRSGCEMLKSLGLGGSGKVAIVFAACVGPANESVTIAEVLPSSAGPPVPLVAAIPTQALHADTARQFLESVESGASVATLTRHGIVPAPH
jgi:molybdate transport system substrate-binding protein